jgi:hypothetical protein
LGSGIGAAEWEVAVVTFVGSRFHVRLAAFVVQKYRQICTVKSCRQPRTLYAGSDLLRRAAFDAQAAIVISS